MFVTEEAFVVSQIRELSGLDGTSAHRRGLTGDLWQHEVHARVLRGYPPRRSSNPQVTSTTTLNRRGVAVRVPFILPCCSFFPAFV
jgi:hypothetical protein